MPLELTSREKKLLLFMRQLGWGEVKIRVENGLPVMIYEAIKTHKLDAGKEGSEQAKRAGAPETTRAGRLRNV